MKTLTLVVGYHPESMVLESYVKPSLLAHIVSIWLVIFSDNLY